MLWACVPDINTYEDVLIAIVKNISAAATSVRSGLETNQLINLFQGAIRDKLFLLVLDDTRDENPELWLSLRSILSVGARGSRILVTTRSQKIADVIEANLGSIYKLQGLREEDSWALFQRIAFGPSRKQIHIAKNIFRMCSGFPYLSVFPRDFEFSFLDVVSLWQAQGFLEPAEPQAPDQDQDQDLEDLVKNYFKTLTEHACIKELTVDEYGNLKTFKMHDMEYKLARAEAIGWETIHLQRHKQANGRKLRTFLCTAPEDNDSVIEMNDIKKLSNFKSLRVLDFHAFRNEMLPDSICNLIHLRYLDLSHNDTLVKLPNSITELYNLQTLKLNSCCGLKELPTEMRKLICLRRLEIDGCDNLTSMPPGFENLSSLRILSRYVIGKPRFQTASGFKSLGNLNKLQGRLMIELSENWSAAVNEALKSNLSKKTRLIELEIKWGPTSCTRKTDALQQQKLLDGLQPPLNLKKLQIEGFRGLDFPNWAAGNNLATALPNLVTVSIDGCGQCEIVPHFSQLQSLKHLTLRFMDKVEYFENFDSRSSASESHFFPCLEELTIYSFYNIKGWQKETQASPLSFGRLKKLKIWSCPKLTSMPLFPNVEVLYLQNFNKKLLEVPKWMADLPSSSNSEIPKLGPIGHLTNLPHLKKLHIKGCPDFKTFALGKNSAKLQIMVVEKLNMLNSLTEDLKQLTSLQELEVAGCNNLYLSGGCQGSCGECEECGAPWKSLSKLHRLTLKELPKLMTLPIGLSFIRTLKVLCISACTCLTALPGWVSNLTSLQHLRLEGCSNLSMLPEELKGLRSLVKVDIIECPKLIERCKEGGEDWHKIKHARVLCHKSWRYAMMSEAGLPVQQKSQNQAKITVHTEDPTIYVDVTVRRS